MKEKMMNGKIVLPSEYAIISEDEAMYVNGGSCVCSSTTYSNGSFVAYICKYHCYYMGEMYQKIGSKLLTASEAISQYSSKIGGVGKAVAGLAAFTCGIGAARFLSEGKIYSSAGISTYSTGSQKRGVRMNMAAGTTSYGLTTC